MAMTRLQFLLGKLSEECVEVAKIAHKAQQFGLYDKHPERDGTNQERIQQELNDILAIVGMLNAEFEFEFCPDTIGIKVKIDKVNKYYEYSKNAGMVE